MSWKFTYSKQPVLRLFTKSGFSLTEALVVVAIIGLTSAIAIPAFIGYKANTEKRELLSKVNSFYAAASVCLMDDEIANCGSKLKIGFYCPEGCSEVFAGPIVTTPPPHPDRLSVLITLNDSKACATYTETAVKELLMKGVCHTTAGMAGFPLLACDTDADCTAAGFSTCYASSVDLSSTKICGVYTPPPP